MDSLKDIRTRITSVKSTRQITSAMKMVSATKLRKAQKAIIQLRPYADKLQQIFNHVCNISENTEENEYLREPDQGKILIICIASDKGLCGAFNSNLVRKIAGLINSEYSDYFLKGNVHFSVIGEKVKKVILAKGWEIIDINNNLFEKPDYDSIARLAQLYMDLFLNKEYDRIDIIYNQFKNAAVQILKHEQYLPLIIDGQKNKNGHSNDYILEPEINYLTTKIIPFFLKVQLYKAFLDSEAAEHGARMTAMHNATDNATMMLSDLRLLYNKARQASITNEILEIVGGAEAQKNR